MTILSLVDEAPAVVPYGEPGYDAFLDLWSRFIRPFDVVHTVSCITGLSVSVVTQLVGVAIAGSPEASRAGLTLLAGRLLVFHATVARGTGPSRARTLAVLATGALLAAPQLVPTLILAAQAGRQVTGLASEASWLPGATGLVLRYASHSPAPSLALAALPLALTLAPVPILGTALLLCLGLQWGRGPLSAPGALALVFELTLCA